MPAVAQSKSMKHLLALTAAVASALTGAGADGGSTQLSFTGEEEGNRVFLGSCPTVSGDGRRFAFEWNDQIWLASTTGGVARCVTPGASKNAYPVLAPDGRCIAFTSNREGSDSHVFVYDAADGRVRQISHHTETTRPCAWASDGTNLLVSVWRDHAATHASRLALLSSTTRADIRVLFDAEGFDPSLSPDGTTLLFRRRGDNVYRKRLRSKETPEAGEIWSFDLKTGAFEPLVTGRVDAREPVWAPDGKGFYYLCAEGGVRNVYYRPIDGQGKGVRLTDFTEDHVFQLSVSADGSTAVFRQLFDFWRLDLRTPGAKPVPIRLVPEAGVEARPATRRRWYNTAWDGDEAGEVAFAPDGKTFAFTTGGGLYVMDDDLREPRLVHDGSLAAARGCVFSPGATNLYFVSDRGDGSDLWRVARADPEKAWWENETFVKTRLASDGEIRRALTISPDGGSLAWRDFNGRLAFADTNGIVRVRGPQTSDPGAFSWSPDGRHVVAQVRGKNLQCDVLIVSTTEEGKVWPLTCNYLFDGNPTWSPDGKVIAWSSVRPDVADGDLLCYVYLDAALEEHEILKSKRKGTAPKEPPEPRPVPFDELRDRVRVTKVKVAAPFFASDSRTVVYASGKVTKRVRLPDVLEPKKIYDRTGRFRRWEKKPDEDEGKMFWIVDNRPAIGNDTYEFKVYLTTDIADYQELAFRTAWARFRDQYYDVNCHGADWPSVRGKYLAAARRATSPSVFARVIRLMQGELDSSHLEYEFDGTARKEWEHAAAFHGWSVETRHLGIRFDPAHRGPGWRIRDVIPDSPVDRCGFGLRPGDVVTRVNGTDVSSDTDPTQILNGPSDMKATIVADGRECRFDTISYGEARDLVGKAAFRERRRIVHERSGDRFGYLNVAAMNDPSLASFRQEVYSEGFGRDGLVIDVRENHGGFTADRMMMSLFCPKHNMWARRGNDLEYFLSYSENPLWYKPIVVLCGEETGSNAEIFSHAISQTGRGRLVGRQTGGAVIATDTFGILDYGTIRVPRFGVFCLDGADMEFNGARPDVEVDNRPDELAKGVDRQLETALGVLKEDVETWRQQHPPVQPVYAR